MVEKIGKFLKKLLAAADSEQVMVLADMLKDLTADIIWHLSIGRDMDLQNTSDGHREKGRWGIQGAMNGVLETIPYLISLSWNPITPFKHQLYK